MHSLDVYCKRTIKSWNSTPRNLLPVFSYGFVHCWVMHDISDLQVMYFHDQEVLVQYVLLEASRTGLCYLFIHLTACLAPLPVSFVINTCPFTRTRAQMSTSSHIVSIWDGLPFRDVLAVCPPATPSTKGLVSKGFQKSSLEPVLSHTCLPHELGRVGALPGATLCQKSCSAHGNWPFIKCN